MTGNGDRLDPVIDTAARLSLMAVLAGAQEVAFAAARDAGGLDDSVVSAQAAALEAAGYLATRKGHLGRRPRILLSLTPTGREALARHISALRRIVDLSDS